MNHIQSRPNLIERLIKSFLQIIYHRGHTIIRVQVSEHACVQQQVTCHIKKTITPHVYFSWLSYVTLNVYFWIYIQRGQIDKIHRALINICLSFTTRVPDQNTQAWLTLLSIVFFWTNRSKRQLQIKVPVLTKHPKAHRYVHWYPYPYVCPAIYRK